MPSLFRFIFGRGGGGEGVVRVPFFPLSPFFRGGEGVDCCRIESWERGRVFLSLPF